MVKRYYMQYRDKNNSLGLHLAVNQEQYNQAREKKRTSDINVVRAGDFLQVVNLNKVIK